MLRDPKLPLLSKQESDFGIYQQVTYADAEWEYVNFNARLMKKGEVWEGDTGSSEFGIILLSGNYSIKTDKGNWETKNGRRNVFNGIAHTLYLPRQTIFKLTAESETLDIACGWCPTDQDHPACFKGPDEVDIEIRGGDNATRQINSLIQPGFDCHRLVCVEVYTPSGNWSSFPAHKHDDRKLDAVGNLIEAQLEEIYFYKIEKPGGYAIQQIYTGDRSLDELMRIRNNELVMVPRGYHPVVAEHAYNCYYLNFLAGSDQSLANSTDPDHEWIFDSWAMKDPRVPVVTAAMNNN